MSFEGVAQSRKDAYIDALCKEIESKGTQCKGRTVKTVYIGGGTPSILECEQISKIFKDLRSAFRISKTAEITVECNPSSITPELLECYRSLGVNRISLGVQSTHKATLNTLGRSHTRKQVHTALTNIQLAGFTNVSVDLIIGVPLPAHAVEGSEIRDLLADLENLLFKTVSSGTDWKRVTMRYPCIKHISVYTLIIEEGTRIESAIRFGNLSEPDEQDWLQEMSDLKLVLDSSPFRMYEVSNYAVRGFECKHNQAYWNPQMEYIGCGLAAHSLLDNKRFSNTENFDDYINNSMPNIPLAERSQQEIIDETIMLALRTTRGVRLADMAVLGHDLMAKRAQEIELLKKLGLVRVTQTHLRATKKGFNLLNQIIEKLA